MIKKTKISTFILIYSLTLQKVRQISCIKTTPAHNKNSHSIFQSIRNKIENRKSETIAKLPEQSTTTKL